jgi:dolichol-phosphate mannosyltransferase
MNDTVVILPTYNEAENIRDTVADVFTYCPDVDVLIVDDNSPDGTGWIADEISAADPRVQVLHREGKEGLGKAYLAGFEWALARHYVFVVEMDADGSHRGEDLARLLRAAPAADLVLGTRWMNGGSAPNWSFGRLTLSKAGSLYSRLMLGLTQRDLTGGFRVYRADLLRRVDLASVESRGYAFQIDLVRRSAQVGAVIVEVPITFIERRAGSSKMSGPIVREALQQVTKWGVRRWW